MWLMECLQSPWGHCGLGPLLTRLSEDSFTLPLGSSLPSLVQWGELSSNMVPREVVCFHSRELPLSVLLCPTRHNTLPAEEGKARYLTHIIKQQTYEIFAHETGWICTWVVPYQAPWWEAMVILPCRWVAHSDEPGPATQATTEEVPSLFQ